MGFYRTRLGCGAEAEMLTKRSNRRVHGGARRKTGNRDSAVSAEWVIRHRVYLILDRPGRTIFGLRWISVGSGGAFQSPDGPITR